jgi:NAD(P)-dependent dehydrogenase (short-subunit alcohol dehydrogenase family)
LDHFPSSLVNYILLHCWTNIVIIIYYLQYVSNDFMARGSSNPFPLILKYKYLHLSYFVPVTPIRASLVIGKIKMPPPNKKIIVVVGATGNQGSSVAGTFLNLPAWHVRCMTRNPTSPSAQKLSSLGAEVVKADLSDPASLSLAFKEAHAIFLNTDFWEPYSGSRAPLTTPESGTKSSSEVAFDLEVSHGKNAAVAAASVGTLERFIYSALGPMKAASRGKYPNSYHWESKAAIVSYIETEQPELAEKTSLIYLGAYTTNPLFTPRFDEKSGNWVFALPMEKEGRMPIIDPVKSTGPFVRALVEDERPGTKLLAYDNYLSMAEIMHVWSGAMAKEGVFVTVSEEKMIKEYGIPVEVLDAPAFVGEFGFMGGIEGWIEPGQLKTKVETKGFGEWLVARKIGNLQQSAEKTLKSITK